MLWDDSLENKITEGKVSIIRSFEVGFDKIAILFENSHTGVKKTLNFSRVIDLSIKADCGVDYHDDMDIMVYRTLIGFHFTTSEKTYIYEMIICDYVIHITSLKPVSLNPTV